jgi:hypothetical protein
MASNPIEGGDLSFVINSPAGLSSRARRFLDLCASRESVDLGLVGDGLRTALMEVYGIVDDQIVQLLERVQSRYSGLTYPSGYFDSTITFSPVCEPDVAEQDLEILYAVETDGPVGASLSRVGEVRVGVDAIDVVEFPSLDALIECDSLFALAEELAFSRTVYLADETSTGLQMRLADEIAPASCEVPEASGVYSYWVTDDSFMLFYCSTWSELNLGLPPFAKLWSANADSIDRIANFLTN